VKEKKAQLRNDFAINAMVVELEKRKKKMPCRRYSYGRLVADTTREEREKIATRYARKAGQEKAERFWDPDDKEQIGMVTDGLVEQ
jgi:hypothetical protein